GPSPPPGVRTAAHPRAASARTRGMRVSSYRSPRGAVQCPPAAEFTLTGTFGALAFSVGLTGWSLVAFTTGDSTAVRAQATPPAQASRPQLSVNPTADF